MTAIIQVESVSKSFPSGDSLCYALKDISFSISSGESVAIVGPSGSGKSTLLSVLAGLDSVTTGTIDVGGHRLSEMSENKIAAVRARLMGFVFQSYRLIPSLTALENVQLPLELLKESNTRPKAEAILSSMGLSSRLGHYPAQLSGGEQQRVAIARAIVHSPQLIFADEPTGNLDSETGSLVTDLLFEKARSCTLVLVTHDPKIAGATARQLHIQDGHLVRH
jgi:putative ABC transport system ATP-binding protein